MRTFSHVWEEMEHTASPDLDSCPECGDALLERGGEKVCAGCGNKQPIITTQALGATEHNWAFVAKMSRTVSEFWEKKAMDDGDAILQRADAANNAINDAVVLLQQAGWQIDADRDEVRATKDGVLITIEFDESDDWSQTSPGEIQT